LLGLALELLAAITGSLPREEAKSIFYNRVTLAVPLPRPGS